MARKIEKSEKRAVDWAWAERMNRIHERLEYARLFGEAA